MPQQRDLTTEKFGRLQPLEQGEPVSHPGGQASKTYDCICDCGNLVTVTHTSLVAGRTRSCGCLRKESTKQRSETLLTHNGQTMNIREWAEFLDVKVTTLYHRRNIGWDIERTLATPTRSTQ